MPNSFCAVYSGFCPESPLQTFYTLITTIFATTCDINESKKYPKDFSSSLRDGEEFDFIVVGSGSAGNVVANKLASNPEWNVLVVEAGTTPSDKSEIPGLLFLLFGSNEEWQFYDEPAQTACLGSKNGRCKLPQGKVLGGTSSINGMVYLRGQKETFDDWAAAGNTGWDWNSVFPFFFENEKLEPPSQAYGAQGLQVISFPDTNDSFLQVARAAGAELGLRSFLGEANLGYIQAPQTVDQGIRANAAKEFLGPLKDRPNLKVAHNTRALRVIVEDLEAKGVEVLTRGSKLTLKARKEVIVSAGAINSPKLLMLSGIGPQEHLEQLGIEVKKDLRVGNNLQDHVGFYGFFGKVSNSLSPSTVNILKDVRDFCEKRKGPLTYAEGYSFSALVNTLDSTPIRNAQIYHNSFSLGTGAIVLGATLSFYGMTSDIVAAVSLHNLKSALINLNPFVLHPWSRGNVRLASKNPLDHPLITTGYLTDSRDVETMLSIIEFLKKILATKTFQEYGATLLDLQLKQCGEFRFDSREYWICYMRLLTISGYHPVGTCKMGPRGDPSAVVDPELKVHGVRKLRVIDSSIMPTITGSNPNAPTLMIGRKGGSMIVEEWTL